MLIETRMNQIVQMVEQKGSVTVSDLMAYFDASESTIRRDLTTLDRNGLLTKVHGGAIAKRETVLTKDDDIFLRKEVNKDSKILIAKYASSFIEANDFIYLDAGTTTEIMIDYMEQKNITVITNAIGHAKKLAQKGIHSYLLGGELKASTEAIVGDEAILSINKYHFTKGFFGTNGITVEEGFTTPEMKEALLKQKAMEQSKMKFVLSDCSKFGKVSSVSFGKFEEATIITTKLTDNNRYEKYHNIKQVL